VEATAVGFACTILHFSSARDVNFKQQMPAPSGCVVQQKHMDIAPKAARTHIVSHDVFVPWELTESSKFAVSAVGT